MTAINWPSPLFQAGRCKGKGRNISAAKPVWRVFPATSRSDSLVSHRLVLWHTTVAARKAEKWGRLGRGLAGQFPGWAELVPLVRRRERRNCTGNYTAEGIRKKIGIKTNGLCSTPAILEWPWSGPLQPLWAWWEVSVEMERFSQKGSVGLSISAERAG